ncbi:hypothetical protein OEZ71_16475 [Defluviimonas sp. WL0050]|uniref:Uncharacterized protein n=1 Tax=Albidovulum litorale TaxID=2984134 RepID=A0ABT2ZRV5_9RHOB|nr:hypothetical protein [Defluviimonas sp. WL0050]MCV2873894.1 hypothetical protein [Defluviimonas sp. WL0050]
MCFGVISWWKPVPRIAPLQQEIAFIGNTGFGQDPRPLLARFGQPCLKGTIGQQVFKTGGFVARMRWQNVIDP